MAKMLVTLLLLAMSLQLAQNAATTCTRTASTQTAYQTV